MSTPVPEAFRTQRVPGQAVGTVGCTVAAALAAMSAYSRGTIGPGTSLDEFYALQLDQVGGIDLYDAKYAASRLGVKLEVYAGYGPGPEYRPHRPGYPERDHDEIGFTDGFRLLEEGRYGVLQVRYSELPRAWWRDPTFRGLHAGALLGARGSGVTRQILWGDPLDTEARWVSAGTLWAASFGLAVTPVREVLRVAGVHRMRFWHRYYKSAGSWRRDRRFTPRGFTAQCSEPSDVLALGGIRSLVHLRTGGYRGSWLDVDGGRPSVFYREEP